MLIPFVVLYTLVLFSLLVCSIWIIKNKIMFGCTDRLMVVANILYCKSVLKVNTLLIIMHDNVIVKISTYTDTD